MKLQGSCVLGISLIVDKTNAEHVYEIVQLLRELGVHNVKISPCVVSNDGTENNRYHQPDYSSVRSQIDRLLEESSNSDFELFDAYHELETKFDKDYEWCPFLQALCVIGADLNVYSCQDKACTAHGALGSIRERSFKEFWHSEENRMKLLSINPSQDCKHHCVAHTKNEVLNEIIGLESDHVFFV